MNEWMLTPRALFSISLSIRLPPPAAACVRVRPVRPSSMPIESLSETVSHAVRPPSAASPLSPSFPPLFFPILSSDRFLSASICALARSPAACSDRPPYMGLPKYDVFAGGGRRVCRKWPETIIYVIVTHWFSPNVEILLVLPPSCMFAKGN